MRADARKNQDRLLEAATRAFARDGADASLKAIAQDAGVGIGTLYRRFPSRERLAWTVYQAEVERICGQASTLLTDHQPDVALRRWMSEFLTFLATKAGMADALKAALAADEVAMVRGEITAALAGMIGAGVRGRHDAFRGGPDRRADGPGRHRFDHRPTRSGRAVARPDIGRTPDAALIVPAGHRDRRKRHGSSRGAELVAATRTGLAAMDRSRRSFVVTRANCEKRR